MNGQVDRAAALLFPEHGRRAVDVKFFFRPGSATAEALAEQVIVSLAALDDESALIANVDHGSAKA